MAPIKRDRGRHRGPRRLASAALAATALLASAIGAGAAPGDPIDTSSRSPLTLAVIGDTPYGDAKLAELPRLIDRVNRDPAVSRVAHLGDIKSGSTLCSDAYFATIRALFDTFEDPLVFTPGDNEWTDCYRTNNGSYFPIERLAALRRIFYPIPGQTKKQVLTQASDPGYSSFVENQLWFESGVAFSALNITGSNNDLIPWTNVTPAQAAQQPHEYQSRLAADIAWLYKTFSLAITQRASGVVLMLQADMWDTFSTDLSGFTPIVQRIAGLAQAFGGPVLLLEGDSHSFRVDHPLTPGDPLYGRYPLGGLAAPNVTRIVVEGATNPTEYLRLKVDPGTPQVFSWQRVPL